MGNRFNVEYYSLLASRIRRHDSDAFTELYHTTYQDLYRYAYYFLKDAHLAQDALHEIYILIWRSISSLKEDRLLYSWMKQITYHVCCDFLRKNTVLRDHETSVPVWDDSILEIWDKKDAFQQVWDDDFRENLNEALSGLPIQSRQAFLLRYENDLKLEEIADFLGCSLSTVKRAINKARKHLQKKLDSL